jgi:pimeloyl-ACP methyl ester carboxylesterase
MDASFLHRDDRPVLAYRLNRPLLASGLSSSALPTVLFCTGFRSDMQGTKALYLQEQCSARGQGCLLFDYSGHGQSGGVFEDGTVGSWTQDALDMLDQLTAGPVVLVGSSLGGWVALNVALARKDRVCGLVGIAAAPDFTTRVMEELTPDQQAALRAEGCVRLPNDYDDEPYVFTAALLADGARHCLLDGSGIDLDVPVRLVQGMEDRDVPWQVAHRIRNAMTHTDKVEVLLVEHGDHRLSRPEDLSLIDAQVRALSGL